jgi:hypothetical protein
VVSDSPNPAAGGQPTLQAREAEAEKERFAEKEAQSFRRREREAEEEKEKEKEGEEKAARRELTAERQWQDAVGFGSLDDEAGATWDVLCALAREVGKRAVREPFESR